MVNNTIQTISNVLKTIATVRAVAHGAAVTEEMAATAGMTTSQLAFNAALYACPLTWIIVAIIAVIAVIYAVVAAINYVTGSSISATGVIAGCIAWLGAFIYNSLLGIVDGALSLVGFVINILIAFANFASNIANDWVASIIHLFGDMADAILVILQGIASMIDKVFGTNLADAVSGWRSGLDTKVSDWADKLGNGSYKEIAEKVDLSSSTFGWERKDLTDAYDAGYNWGEGLGDKFKIDGLTGIGGEGSGLDYDALLSQVGDIGDNTKDIKNSVDVSEEDLKYLRDLAEQETINRFTTAEITVAMGGVTNNIGSGDDIDGIMDVITDSVCEGISIGVEGVHE